MPLPHQFIEYELLRLALQGSSDGLGYGTSLPALWKAFRYSLPAVEDQQIVDALLRLHPQYLTLWKWNAEQNRHLEYPGVWSDEDFFYRDQFRLRRTPNTDIRHQELATLFLVTGPSQHNMKMKFSPLKAFLPNANDVLEAGLDRLGESFLQHLKTYEGGGTVHQPIGGFNRGYSIGVMEGRNLGLGPLSTQAEYAERQPEVSRRMQEAWNWAVTKGYLMHNPDQPHPDWFVLTSEGEKLLAGPNTQKRPTVPAEDVRLSDTQQSLNTGSPSLSRKVFVVHGHDEGAREKIARFLERLGFEPIILHEQANRGRTVIEKVEAHSDVGYAVVVLTPDDEGCKKGGTPRPRPRQNVLLELGYFIGRLGRTHVCALKGGDDLELPSDFEGVVYVSLDGSEGWKRALGREMEAVGFQIDWNKAMGAGA